jgi:hypothetical protein
MRTLLIVFLFCQGALPAAAAEKSPLGEALKDIDVADHWIYDDWPRAVAEAKATGKPLMVVLRCVPCPPGKALDLAVMQPDKGLAELEKKFVCVRIIQGNRLDLDLFQYDYDMSWAAMFLNADKTIYGRYGSRDAHGPESDRLLSGAGFRKAAERALALHAAYPKNRASLTAKTGPKAEYRAANEIPGLGDRPAVATERKNCIHCHMLKEFALRAKWEEGKLSTQDLFVHPLPQTIGITTDIEDGLTVIKVEAGSAAAAAGIRAGDELTSINGQPLISLADIQWALHQAPNDGELKVQVRRDGAPIAKTIALSGDWKRADIAWRASSWLGLRKGLKTETLTASEKKSLGIDADGLAHVVKGLYGQPEHPAKKAGLKLNDVIVAFDGSTADMDETEFLLNLRLKHGPHDMVKFTVLREGQRRELTIPMW